MEISKAIVAALAITIIASVGFNAYQAMQTIELRSQIDVLRRELEARPAVAPKYFVPIVNKYMTRDEIREGMLEEGEITIVYWPLEGYEWSLMVPSFEVYLEKYWGIPKGTIKVDLITTLEAGVEMTKLYAAYKAGKPPPQDVFAVEQNFYAEAHKEGITEVFIPSPIIDLNEIDPEWRDFYVPWHDGLIFQDVDSVALIVNEGALKEAGIEIKGVTDLADPRMKGKILMPLPGTVTSITMLIAVAFDKGLNYKDPDDMKEAIMIAAHEIGPNVLKYSESESEMMELMKRGEIWATIHWWLLGPIMAYRFDMPITVVRPEHGKYVFNPGVFWITKGCQHPLLAQAYIDSQLKPERTACVGFEEVIETKGDWVWMAWVLYNKTHIKYLPDWMQADYEKIYPYPPTEAFVWYEMIDWDYVIKWTDTWTEWYKAELG